MAEPRRRKFPAGGAGNFLLFVGREAERTLLAAQLDRAHLGESRIVVLHGPVGIGKTSLLRWFLSTEHSAVRLQACGDELESSIVMGGLRHLLRAAGGEAEADLSPDPVAGGVTLAERLRGMTASGTVIVVLDDCQLLDRPSLDAVTVAMRELEHERVLWLLSTSGQPVEVFPSGVQRLVAAGRAVAVRLGGLESQDLLAWCQRQAGVPLAHCAAQRLQRVAAGNPGRVSDLVAEHGWPALRRCSGLPPATRGVRSVVADAMATLMAPAAAFVKAAAILGDIAPVATVEAIAATADPAVANHSAAAPDPAEAIDSAVGCGILAVPPQPGAEVHFADPMIRAAVYAGLGVAERARLHRAAADVTTGAVALEHRLAGVVGADAAVADDAEAWARRLAGRDEQVAAARLLLSAALASPQPHRRDRTVKAARLLLEHGDAAEAAMVVEGLSPDDPAAPGLAGNVALALGSWSDAGDHLRRVPSDDPGIVAVSRLHLARRQIPQAVKAAREGVQAQAPTAGAALALALAIGGDPTAARDALAAAAAEDDAAGAAALAQGVVAFERGELELAATLLSAAGQRTGGCSVADRLMALRYLALCRYVSGSWEAATAAARDGLELASRTSHRADEPGLQAVLFLIAAGAGEAQVLPDGTQDTGGSRPADPASEELLAWGELEAAGADPTRPSPTAAAVAAGMPELGSVWPGWQAPYVEFLIAAGRVTDAQALLVRLLDHAGQRPWLAATLIRAQGAVAAAAGSADAGALFERAVSSFDRMPAPLDAARARIALGRFLRRTGRREEAVPALTLAVETCEGLGARSWHEQARHELALCGTGRRSSKRGAELTPQESSVAQLAAQGLSSREIANRLTVSIKTVEYHLGNVYAKLDIRSRTQLAVRFRKEQ